MPLSAGGRYDCPRVRASARWPGGQTASLLAWLVDGAFLRQQKPSRMALAWWVDGGLAGLAGRRGLLGRRAACCRFPAHPRTLERTPRAERSDRKTTAPPSPQRKPPIQARGSGYRFKIPQVCTAQQNTNQNQGHRLPKSGGHHNRRPTGGVRLSTKLIRCNDYPTSAAPAEPPREANHKTGFLGKAATRRRRREERAAFEEGPRLAGAGSAGQPVWPDGEQERRDWRPV